LGNAGVSALCDAGRLCGWGDGCSLARWRANRHPATIGRTQAAYYPTVNDAGGVNGRKIDFITLDDC
jgi:hypothetical protein